MDSIILTRYSLLYGIFIFQDLPPHNADPARLKVDGILRSKGLGRSTEDLLKDESKKVEEVSENKTVAESVSENEPVVKRVSENKPVIEGSNNSLFTEEPVQTDTHVDSNSLNAAQNFNEITIHSDIEKNNDDAVPNITSTSATDISIGNEEADVPLSTDIKDVPKVSNETELSVVELEAPTNNNNNIEKPVPIHAWTPQQNNDIVPSDQSVESVIETVQKPELIIVNSVNQESVESAEMSVEIESSGVSVTQTLIEDVKRVESNDDVLTNGHSAHMVRIFIYITS